MHQTERVRQSLIGLEFVVVHSWMSSLEDEKGPSGVAEMLLYFLT